MERSNRKNSPTAQLFKRISIAILHRGQKVDSDTFIELQPFTESDIERLIGWVPSARFLLQWAGPAYHYPLDETQIEHQLAASKEESPSHLMYKAVNPKTGETVGHGEIGNINYQNRSATLMRILVGPPTHRGLGLGEKIVEALLRIGFMDMSLHRIELRVYNFNKEAIRCYEKAGFKKEGLLREATKFEDEYWNVYVMAILESEWLNAMV